MAFGQSRGYPASHRQVQRLTELINEAGHVDFRDARGPLGLSQRQANGKFTGPEADELIERLEAEADAELEGSAPPPRPEPDPGERRRAKHRDALERIPTDVLAAELQDRGWVVLEP